MTLFKLTVVGLIAVVAAVVYSGGSASVTPPAQEAQARPVQVMAWNQNFCTVAGVAFAGLAAFDAITACGGLEIQSSLQQYVACIRGSDEDLDAINDCADPSEIDPDGTIDITYDDFAALDLDANQVHAGQTMLFFAFVDDEAGVRFTTDEGSFLSRTGALVGKDYFCTDDPVPDPDCDDDPSTVGDGVVIARLRITADDDRGEHEVIIIQEGLGFPQPFTITGTPDRITLEPLFGKNAIQTGGTAPTQAGQVPSPDACNLSLSVAGVLGAIANPYQTIVVGKAFDSDGTELAIAGLLWDPPYNPHTLLPAGDDYIDPADIGGVSTPLSPTVDTGALGLGFPELVCSKDEVGTLTLESKFDVASNLGLVSGGGDLNERASVEIEVLPPPGELTLVADPPALECNGTNTTTITATVLTTDGRNVANGNDVNFDISVLGTANPLSADSTDGKASSVITPLGPAGTGVPVIVSVGEPTRNKRNADNTVNVGEEEPNPDFIERSIVVQCVAGTGAAPGGGEPPAPVGQPGAGARPPTGVITGPNTGSGGELAGSGPLSIWSAVMLFVGAMGLIGARFALRRG